jgi:hypothetical protein
MARSELQDLWCGVFRLSCPLLHPFPYFETLLLTDLRIQSSRFKLDDSCCLDLAVTSVIHSAHPMMDGEKVIRPPLCTEHIKVRPQALPAVFLLSTTSFLVEESNDRFMGFF